MIVQRLMLRSNEVASFTFAVGTFALIPGICQVVLMAVQTLEIIDTLPDEVRLLLGTRRA